MEVTYTYDDNDKLTAIETEDGGPSASFGYDGNGNGTSVTGTMFGSISLVYDDANRLTSITYPPNGTDSFTWNALGQRMRASTNGTVFRYVYNGDRVFEVTNDAGGPLARYLTADESYYAPLLYFKTATPSHRYPIYDLTGTVHGLANESGTGTDSYGLDAFGRQMSSAGSTTNPYRFGGGWGYMTDTPGSGLLQLGRGSTGPRSGGSSSRTPSGMG